MTFTKLKKHLFVAILLIPMLILGIVFALPARRASAEREPAVHTYTESLDQIVNPATGFYYPITITLTPNNDSMPLVWGNTPLQDFMNGTVGRAHGLLHLRFDLAAFSAAAGGTDADIDDKSLAKIEKFFRELRRLKVGAIIRFDYDRNGVSANGVGREPALEQIVKHIKSVASVVSDYSDVVLGVESGMIGPWGEQHSTPLTRDPHSFYEVVQTWLDNTPDEIGITVRRPLFFTYWANEKYGLDMTVNDLGSFDFTNRSEAKRVGMFNDGYLGSSSDLGTFTDRAVETAFIGTQAENTFYGGELMANGDANNAYIGEYNRVENIEVEAFVTHTSYLNIAWNDNVISSFKNRPYNGKDELYKNGNATEFTYLNNHLGYRFYLSESTDAVTDNDGNANFKFTISNVGFSRIIRAARSELVFKKVGTTVAVKTIDCTNDVNLRDVPSAGAKTFEFAIPVPSDLALGDYDVYLRFYTEYGAEIKMANDVSVCANESREGVKVATFTNSARATLTELAIVSQPIKTEYTVGDTFDITGLKVTATYSNGTAENVRITPSMLSDYDMSTAGTYHVKITFDGKSVTFDITVNAAQTPDPPHEDPPSDDPPDKPDNPNTSFGETIKNFIADNAVIVGIVGAAVAVAVIVVIIVAVKRKKK